MKTSEAKALLMDVLISNGSTPTAFSSKNPAPAFGSDHGEPLLFDTDPKHSNNTIKFKKMLGIPEITGQLIINFVKMLTFMNKIYWTVMTAMSLFIALGLFLAASATQKREARMTMQRHLLDLPPR